MRFYQGSHERLIKQSRIAVENQRLFLVQDVSNASDANAIMLHDGEKKLGSVNAEQAKEIKKLLVDTNDVVVCSMSYVAKNFEGEFKTTPAFKIRGQYMVNERLARKFADQFI